MINLPLLESLDVSDYGLYPGVESEPGLHIRFEPGLTLVLGANGLGKTTLVTMLYRMLTGPSDIPRLRGTRNLGTADLNPRPLSRSDVRAFAKRVADGGARATARLVFYLGGRRVSIERRLSDLSLEALELDGSELGSDEETYQSEVVRLGNVSSFGDWILLLRYVVFYFEDRRSLIWDPSAQRELLRILFLSPESAETWTEKAREILEDDSTVRNLRAAVNRAERDLAESESLVSEESSTRADLLSLEQEQERARGSLEDTEANLSALASEREDARLQFIRLEHDRDSKYRELERAQLLAIEARLPQYSDSARYVLAQIFTENECLVCGSEAEEAVASFGARISANECIICGSRVVVEDRPLPAELALNRVNRQQEQLVALDEQLQHARSTLDRLVEEFDAAFDDAHALRAAIARHQADIDTLTDRLPPADAELREQRREFASLHAQIDRLERELNAKRNNFVEMVDELTSAVIQQASDVKVSFEEYAHEFLFEDCQLSWLTRREQLGQFGRHFEFPVFELDLRGSDFNSVVRRRGPDDVSESQREFIDLSFRMALARVAELRGVTSLVMDAPESSLDAVFTERAARVLGTFGQRELGNRLVITSNLVAGELIPRILVEATEPGDRDDRVVDLLDIAAPTAAIAEFGPEYREARDLLLGRADAAD